MVFFVVVGLLAPFLYSMYTLWRFLWRLFLNIYLLIKNIIKNWVEGKAWVIIDGFNTKCYQISIYTVPVIFFFFFLCLL